MFKNIIVSNRLPIKITKINGSFDFKPSTGGLATGLSSIHKNNRSLWVGWTGLSSETINDEENNYINQNLKKLKLSQIRLNSEEINDFYFGMSNKCLWPLFHYFIEFSIFESNMWDAYKKINEKFCDHIVSKIDQGGTVWIHDYQLLLLPKMIKEIRPDVTIGFFLHIPFPSFEIFRIFPWRIELLEGMLGSDLIGFHTFDYQRHFLSSVKRILMYDVLFNKVILGTREIIVNTFPMGIDFNKFFNAAKAHQKRIKSEKTELKKQLELHKKNTEDSKFILSIDRLDYTKGVINRLKSFEIFLNKYPQYLEKVRLLMLTVPSRSDVPEYKRLKKETDELVGRINGNYATVNWTPVWYYYREMKFDDLIDLYMSSDIAMITPVRDGMNLVAKEFVATRVDKKGVLILSEMAGASKELYDSVTINPFDLNSMADSIYKALNMSLEEQIRRNTTMQKRLSRYNVEYWANAFFEALKTKSKDENEKSLKKIDKSTIEILSKKFNKSKNRAFLLDYDGTLVNFHHKPEVAIPTKDVISILNKITNDKKNKIYIVSGRDKYFLDKNLNISSLGLVAEHGHYIKPPKSKWKQNYSSDNKWKQNFVPIFQDFSDRTPGTFVEEKNNCLVWHYRKTDPELANIRVVELKTVIKSMLSENLTMLDGNKAIEVTNADVNKGTIINSIINNNKFDFILCAGDDITDENMFKALPNDSISIKVGKKSSSAEYFVKNPNELLKLFEYLLNK